MVKICVTSLVDTQTCNGERIDDSGDDQVGQGEVGGEHSSGVVVGRLGAVASAVQVLDDHHGDDDQVAECSDDGRQAEHSDVQTGEHSVPAV